LCAARSRAHTLERRSRFKSIVESHDCHSVHFFLLARAQSTHRKPCALDQEAEMSAPIPAAASPPSVEEIVMGTIAGLPKLVPHWRDSGPAVTLDEEAVPVRDEVRGARELVGDPLPRIC